MVGFDDEFVATFVQNIRRGHNELAVDTEAHHRLTAAFTELTPAI